MVRHRVAVCRGDIVSKAPHRCFARYWFLHELTRVRASVRIGTQSSANALKERKALQRALVKIRHARAPQ